MLKFKDITLSYGTEQVLRDADFLIKDGEFVLLTGKSGAGKTSIVNLLLGALHPQKGQVLVNGLVVNELNPHDLQLYRRTLGVVFQDYKLLPKRTVFENVAFALEVAGVGKSEIEKRVPEVLRLVGLEKMSHKFPGQLSGGEKQRVSIARAMVHKPQLLIADEPTGNLDSENTAEIIKLLLTINKTGTTVILATHDQAIVNNLKRRTLVVEGTKVTG